MKKTTLTIFAAMLILCFVLSACTSPVITQDEDSAPDQTPATSPTPAASESAAEPEQETAPATNAVGQQTEFNPDTPIVEKDDTIYISNSAVRIETYDTLQALNENTESIIVGTCTSAETVFQNETIYTLSAIEVSRVFKGDITEGTVIQIVENGGTTTEDVYAIESGSVDKAYFNEESVSAARTITIGLDGYFHLVEGQEVLLFLNEIPGFLEEVSEMQYGITGSYDGKLLKSSDTTFARPLPSNDSEISPEQMTEGALTVTISELEEIAESDG